MLNIQSQTIKLNAPNLKRGLPLMEAMSTKCSAREYSPTDLSIQDLSDLLWAATGLNRPDENKTTASSAMNTHDIDVYVFMKDAVYIYNLDDHTLDPVLDGDYRDNIITRPLPAECSPPVQMMLVSDISRFSRGGPEMKIEWAGIDSGIVSQNISLFCAATDLCTRPMSSIKKDEIKRLLQLGDEQLVMLGHPVGYPMGG